MSDCSHESCCTEAARLRAENKLLLSANDTLVLRIEDLTEGYALKDTCPRVQCLTTSKRLKAQVDEIHAAYKLLAAERDAMQAVVNAAIAVIETDKRLYHGSAEHAEAEAEAAFTTLDEAVDAYRMTTTPGTNADSDRHNSHTVRAETEPKLLDPDETSRTGRHTDA